MPPILASCSGCGDVVLRPDDVALWAWSVDDGFDCSFRCPVCGLRTTRHVHGRLAERLRAAGCAVGIAAAELPPLTERDVRAFARLLEQDGWIDRLVE
jgi:hypothetical protein